MKIKSALLVGLGVVLMGGAALCGGFLNVSAIEVDEQGTKWYSSEEVLEIREEVVEERKEVCPDKEDWECLADFANEKIIEEQGKDEKFNLAEFMGIGGVDVVYADYNANKLGIFYYEGDDELGMMGRAQGEIDGLTIYWYEEGAYSNVYLQGSMEKLIEGDDSVEGIHIVYHQDREEGDEEWMKSGTETVIEVDGDLAEMMKTSGDKRLTLVPYKDGVTMSSMPFFETLPTDDCMAEGKACEIRMTAINGGIYKQSFTVDARDYGDEEVVSVAKDAEGVEVTEEGDFENGETKEASERIEVEDGQKSEWGSEEKEVESVKTTGVTGVNEEKAVAPETAGFKRGELVKAPNTGSEEDDNHENQAWVSFAVLGVGFMVMGWLMFAVLQKVEEKGN